MFAQLICVLLLLVPLVKYYATTPVSLVIVVMMLAVPLVKHVK
jgi:hypothetical protein